MKKMGPFPLFVLRVIWVTENGYPWARRGVGDNGHPGYFKMAASLVKEQSSAARTLRLWKRL